MELRWILILAGIAILFFLYLSGRPRKARPSVPAAGAQHYQSANAAQQNPAPAPVHNLPQTAAQHYGVNDSAGDPLLEEQHFGDYPRDPREQYGNDYPEYADRSYSDHSYAEYQAVDSPVTGTGANRDVNSSHAHSNVQGAASGGTLGFELDPGDMSRPASPGVQSAGLSRDEYGVDGIAHPVAAHHIPNQPKSSLGATLGSISQRLRGKRGKSAMIDHSLNPAAAVQESKIISLHVVAPQGQVIHGPRLLALFESHNFHFGEMNIFHSLHDGKIVFSVAKMVEPGEFNLNVPASFETPGITMILQLPGPVSADVAFEVLIGKSQEIADALGCTVLDSGHSTLSKQTVQHMREEVYQFMHRQRVAEAVSS